ncbi:MAG: HD domain-containing protein [Bacteroidia bacterium]
MTKQERLEKTAEYIKSEFSGEGTGHDWWHIVRVWNLATKLAKLENANLYITEMAALLHDLDDWKFNELDEPVKAIAWLNKIGEETDTQEHIIKIIKNVSYKGAGVKTSMTTIEGKCVQDADRLDALGAIGIARTFAYGGYKGNEIYNPNIKPTLHQSFEDYKNKSTHTINHFYEKLLLLKDRMNTDSAKQLANERHAFMMVFLDEFYNEWKGEA